MTAYGRNVAPLRPPPSQLSTSSSLIESVHHIFGLDHATCCLAASRASSGSRCIDSLVYAAPADACALAHSRSISPPGFILTLLFTA